MGAPFDTSRTSRQRRVAAQWAVVLWLGAVLAQASAPWLHALCAEAVDCESGHPTAVAVQPLPSDGAAGLVGHAADHAHRGSTHDAATCPLCRSLQHTTLALAPVAVAVVVPLRPITPDGSLETTPPRDGAGDRRIPRAPPARA